MARRKDRQEPNGSLSGKVALVTGAGQGLGRGISLALSAQGASIAVVGRTKSKLLETTGLIEERGGRALPFTCDVTDPEQVEETVADVADRLGSLDIVVNNAQDFAFGPLLAIDAESVEQGWRSGPQATLDFMRSAHPRMTSGGVIINVSSSAASDPSPGVGVYAAVKAAIEALTRTAALEFAGDGIRVNTIVPFAITPAVRAALDANPGHEEALLASVPLGRFGDAETDVGRAVAFLAGPDASFITGSTLVVDGGSAYLR